MPELPEVETVRDGLHRHVVGKAFTDVFVLHPRAVRHVEGGAAEVVGRLTGRTIAGTGRRGKFMWLTTDDDQALLVHLGMSGQMLVKSGDQRWLSGPAPRHVRAAAFLNDATQVWFVDQRTFGYWWPQEFVHAPDGAKVPESVAHIAPDLVDPRCDLHKLAALIKTKRLAIKTILLNQEIVSGVGNIYADEMLWRAKVHPRQKAHRMKVATIVDLLRAGQDVLTTALAQGGTSFDALYVNVNGQSGYFDRSLNAYGQQGLPCARCGIEIVREKFQNRSSHFCPRCQRAH